MIPRTELGSDRKAVIVSLVSFCNSPAAITGINNRVNRFIATEQNGYEGRRKKSCLTALNEKFVFEEDLRHQINFELSLFRNRQTLLWIFGAVGLVQCWGPP